MTKTTTCSCGAKVTYTTNKPKRCKTCREKHEAKFPYMKRKPHRSKKEAVLQQLLNELLPNEDYIDNGYYSWLMSPKGSPLQLDRFYPNLMIGFEFNGRQHYEFNPYMHKNIEAFEYLQRCDKKKMRDCKRKGVYLITIKYNRALTRSYLISRLKEAGIIIK